MEDRFASTHSTPQLITEVDLDLIEFEQKRHDESNIRQVHDNIEVVSSESETYDSTEVNLDLLMEVGCRATNRPGDGGWEPTASTETSFLTEGTTPGIKRKSLSWSGSVEVPEEKRTSKGSQGSRLTFSIADSNALRARVSEARQAGRVRRWRISAPCLSIGMLFIAFGETTWIVGNIVGNGSDIYWALVVALGVAFVGPGFIMLLLSALPTDRCAPRAIVLFCGCCLLLGIVYGFRQISRGFGSMNINRCKIVSHDIPCGLVPIDVGAWIVTLIVWAFCICHLARSTCQSYLKALPTLWRVCGYFVLSVAFKLFVLVIIELLGGLYTNLSADAFLTIFYTLLGVLVSRPEFRLRVQSWLVSRGKSVAGAASIAALLGGGDSDAIIAEAKEHFRCVPADKISAEDMEKQDPDPSLFFKTEPASLGKVDAFLSHSWHDNADEKWRALQAWREDFKMKHHREPTLWIDKYCIDQRNIENSLRCLPLYLTGCHKLLILCGPTYLERLWCLIEVFIFKEMGGHLCNFEARLISDPNNLAELNWMRAMIKNFDVYAARCFLEDDEYRLFTVVEAGADGVEALKDLIKSIFTVALDRCQGALDP